MSGLDSSFISLHGKEDKGSLTQLVELRWLIRQRRNEDGIWTQVHEDPAKSFYAHNWADGEKADVFGCTAGDWPEISVPEPREKQQAYKNQGCQGITLHAPDLIASQTKQHNLQSVLG